MEPPPGQAKRLYGRPINDTYIHTLYNHSGLLPIVRALNPKVVTIGI